MGRCDNNILSNCRILAASDLQYPSQVPPSYVLQHRIDVRLSVGPSVRLSALLSLCLIGFLLRYVCMGLCMIFSCLFILGYLLVWPAFLFVYMYVFLSMSLFAWFIYATVLLLLYLSFWQLAYLFISCSVWPTFYLSGCLPSICPCLAVCLVVSAWNYTWLLYSVLCVYFICLPISLLSYLVLSVSVCLSVSTRLYPLYVCCVGQSSPFFSLYF